MKKDEENFGTLYTRLYNENFVTLEKLRRKEQTTALFSILGCIVIFFALIVLFKVKTLEGFLIPIIVTVSIIVSLVRNIKKKMFLGYMARNYISEFKTKVIGPIINNAIPNSIYNKRGRIDRFAYDSSGLAESYDQYKSEDLIEFNMELPNKQDKMVHIKLSEVLTKQRIENDNGRDHYVTKFNGMLGVAQLTKDIEGYIKITKNGRISKKSHRKVEMDIAEFEKMFDVESTNKVLAMRVLTSDVIIALMDLLLESKIKFEFNIRKDILYVRFHTGPMYEPSLFRKSLEFASIKRFYTNTKLLLNVCRQIALVVDELEI